jgi:hypothetical protein
MPHGPSQNARRVRRKKAGLAPLLRNSVEDVDTARAHPLLRLATGLLFSQRTRMRPREPIITNADEFAMNFEGVCVPFSNVLRAGDFRREPMS